jgi:hypothetical protein
MYRVVLGSAAATLLITTVIFIDMVVERLNLPVVGEMTIPFTEIGGIGLGVQMLTLGFALMFVSVMLALILALWNRQPMWIWGLGLQLSIGLFGWMSLVYAPLTLGTVAFLPPLVTLAYGWTQQRSRAQRLASPVSLD